MKRNLLRLLALLLMLLTLVPAALGEGELRGYNKKDGYVYLTMGVYPQTAEGDELPILWRVLSVEDGKAYILSEYVLLAKPIHSDYQEYANKPTNAKKPGFDGDFTQTEMSQYLNGEFTAYFTTAELAQLLPDETLGSFFLVTADDLKDTSLGFGTNQSRKAWGTEYAIENGLFVYGSKYGKHSPYWTRNQSTSDARHARCTKDEGEIGRINVITLDLGMRPACYLDMSKVEIVSGTGTMEDPFVLNAEAETPALPAADLPEEAADELCCAPGECACCASCDCGCQSAE